MNARIAVLDPAAEAPAIVDALLAQMESLRNVVQTLSEHTFRATPSGCSGSVGEHVRHCLDHVRSLTSAVDAAEMSYDSRLRGTAVEMDPDAALDEIDRILRTLDQLNDGALDRSIILRTLPHRGGLPVRVRTTLEREVVFVVQHTIHHSATLAVLLERMRVPVPADFGYAPSTPTPRPSQRLPR